MGDTTKYPGLGIPRSLQSPVANPGRFGFSAPSKNVLTPADHSNIGSLDATPYFMRTLAVNGQKAATYQKSNPIGHQKDPILATLPALAMKNGAQQTYTEGDFLFVNRNLKCEDYRETVLNLPYLNAILEESCVLKRGNYIGEKRSHNTMLRLGDIKVADADKEEMYCTTVREFSEKWQYCGPLHTMLGDTKDRQRVFTVIMKRAAKVPNLWGQVDTGDRVGFMVKEIQNPYHSRYGPLGEVISGPTTGKILQIVPHTTKWRKYPVHSSSQVRGSGGIGESNRPSDICFQKNQTMENQKLYAVHEEDIPDQGIYRGMLDMRSPITSEYRKNTIVDIVESGLYIPVGMVTEVYNASPPTEEQINDALRRPDDYKRLLATNRLEVVIMKWI